MTDPSHPAGQRPPASARTLAVGVGATVLVLLAAGALAVLGMADEATDAADDGDVPVPPSAEADAPELSERVDPTETAPLPDIALAAFDSGDGQVRTTDYEGTPLLLNFWASWCSPCVEEMPDLQEVADRGAGRLAVLGVNIDDDPDKAAAMVDSLGISYDLAVDTDGDLFREIEGFGMPTTLFVTADGVIRYRHTGALDAETIDDLAREHLGVEPGARR